MTEIFPGETVVLVFVIFCIVRLVWKIPDLCFLTLYYSSPRQGNGIIMPIRYIIVIIITLFTIDPVFSPPLIETRSAS